MRHLPTVHPTNSPNLFLCVHKRGLKQIHTVQQIIKRVRLLPEFADRFDEYGARRDLEGTDTSNATYRSGVGLVGQVDDHKRRVLVVVRSINVVSSQKHVHGVNVLLLQSVHLNDRVQLRETEAEIGLGKLDKKEHLSEAVAT